MLTSENKCGSDVLKFISGLAIFIAKHVCFLRSDGIPWWNTFILPQHCSATLSTLNSNSVADI